ncbi:MAG TPA: hypothetical protein VFY28_02145 [Candidatus Paceibacterota bacterium]|nr:hypothetical protein [Candidatus Paceibacterota bacterium]
MKQYLTHFLVALLVLVAAFAAYAGWYLAVRAAVHRSAELAGEVELSIERVTAAAETRDVLASLAEDEAAIHARFVAVEDVALFLEELEATGGGLGSAVSVVSVADKPTVDGRIAIMLRVRGPYESVVRTVGAIEYGPHDTRFENMTLDTAKEDGEGWVATISLSAGIASAPATAAPK